jgi:ubiquinone/menaquinone biosynthesis C-methylase UbiE
MLDKLQLTEYKQAIAESYDRRSHSYDDSDWHLQICSQLLTYSQIESEQYVLDIGTGTGHLAIGAARIVGGKGRVIGIDISPEMIETAQRKAKALGLKNIQFQLADAEQLNYPDHSFDHILCANTFPWLEDKAATLASWYRLLKPGGGIGIHTPADTAYVGAVILKKVLTKYGVSIEPSNRIGSIIQCRELFKYAGFESIELKTHQYGSYATIDRLKATWKDIITNPSTLSLKDNANHLSQLSLAQLITAKAEFEAELETLQTDQGIWDDLTTLYILGRKQSDCRVEM